MYANIRLINHANYVAQHTIKLNNINQREMFDLKKFRTDMKLSQRELARQIEVDHTVISKAENHGIISDRLVSSLINNFPEIKGQITSNSPRSTLDNVQKLGVSCATVVNIATMKPTGEQLAIPNLPDGCIAVMNRGDGLSPAIKSGDMVVVRPINVNVLPYGELVLAIVGDLRLVRALRRSNFDDYVRLESKHGDAIELKVAEISTLYIVVAVIQYLSL